MTDDKAWDRIVDAIDAKFGIQKHGRGKRNLEDNHELTEDFAWVQFERSGQLFKIERTHGPAITDRKTIGARRAGATVHYENVYDPSELTFRTRLFVENEAGEWDETNADALGLMA